MSAANGNDKKSNTKRTEFGFPNANNLPITTAPDSPLPEPSPKTTGADTTPKTRAREGAALMEWEKRGKDGADRGGAIERGGTESVGKRGKDGADRGGAIERGGAESVGKRGKDGV